MLSFQQYDLIIFNVSADFGICSCMWNSTLLSYPCDGKISPIVKLLILKDDLYIFLKVINFGEDQLNRFRDI